MTLLKKILGKKDSNSLQLRFIKKDNIWHVTKGYTIMYMGDKAQCEKYLSHMSIA